MGTREQFLRHIDVSKTDFVIDIGGGHRPFWRADLVIEKHPFEHSLHRTQPMQFPDIPVIKADAIAIPVPNGGCDLIFASHILEHLPDPIRFIDEIKRCSKRVYLEFPSRYRELMFAWSFHEWLVEYDGKVLRFYRNDLPQLFGRLFHEEYDAALGAWSEARHEHLNTSIYCSSDELECEFPTESATEMLLRSSPSGTSKINSAEFIHRPRYSIRETLAFVMQGMLPNSVYARLSRHREGSSSPATLPDSVISRLMCLQCHAATLHRNKETLTCECGAQYFQDRNVFNFDT